jgi:hypothetical protein
MMSVVAAGVPIAQFAVAYADQNERDHQSLLGAVASGRLTAERDM